jgi:hypothetical protein
MCTCGSFGGSRKAPWHSHGGLYPAQICPARHVPRPDLPCPARRVAWSGAWQRSPLRLSSDSHRAQAWPAPATPPLPCDAQRMASKPASSYPYLPTGADSQGCIKSRQEASRSYSCERSYAEGGARPRPGRGSVPRAPASNANLAGSAPARVKMVNVGKAVEGGRARPRAAGRPDAARQGTEPPPPPLPRLAPPRAHPSLQKCSTPGARRRPRRLLALLPRLLLPEVGAHRNHEGHGADHGERLLDLALLLFGLGLGLGLGEGTGWRGGGVRSDFGSAADGRTGAEQGISLGAPRPAASRPGRPR